MQEKPTLITIVLLTCGLVVVPPASADHCPGDTITIPLTLDPDGVPLPTPGGTQFYIHIDGDDVAVYQESNGEPGLQTSGSGCTHRHPDTRLV